MTKQGLIVAVAALLLCGVIYAVRVASIRQSSAAENESATPDISPKSVAAKDASDPATETGAPVIVELFTSEGCSSCPPADTLLQKLDAGSDAQNARVIPLSLHVDYWNRLGWADPFSAAAYSQRQNDYADAFHSDGVYTPQMVVDGHAEFVGSNESQARAAIAAAAHQAKATVTLARAGDTALKIEISELPANRNAAQDAPPQVMLAITESRLQSNVTRGENSGRKLTHAAVVRSLVSLGAITDGKFSATPELKLQPEWQRSNLRAVVFIQEPQTRRILGANALMLQ